MPPPLCDRCGVLLRQFDLCFHCIHNSLTYAFESPKEARVRMWVEKRSR